MWRPRYFILDGHGNPKPEPDTLRWGQWFAALGERVVQRDEMPILGIVSTVFLGIDHNFNETGPPVLWETMVFGGALDQFQQRYTSRVEALAGHRHILRVLIQDGGMMAPFCSAVGFGRER